MCRHVHEHTVPTHRHRRRWGTVMPLVNIPTHVITGTLGAGTTEAVCLSASGYDYFIASTSAIASPAAATTTTAVTV